jgi:hypothetical protein
VASREVSKSQRAGCSSLVGKRFGVSRRKDVAQHEEDPPERSQRATGSSSPSKQVKTSSHATVSIRKLTRKGEETQTVIISEKLFKKLVTVIIQCCGSGMFVPGSRSQTLIHPGSNNNTIRGEGKFFVIKTQWVWDPGSEIRHKTYSGSRVKNAPDPGSATLIIRTQ